ncbi:MAG: MFS transporter [Proteobacteria bacterium]|nr:MFS transporter [Pseudomonadota bacterium]MBK9250660.1 MFS transporter [Pseudomonadota bacterium]MCC6633693.1 MFS transporter [Gammaproteobacteria bacterium]
MSDPTPQTAKPRIRDVLRQPRMLAILLLGGASGLPNPLSEATMQAWLTDLGISNTRIGLLMYVALPYLLKPLWAPLLDRYSLPWLGRRRGWILTFQLLLAASIASLATFSGEHQLTGIALALLVLVFLSASQDVVIDAYRTDVARPAERGLAAAATNLGYRALSYGSLSVALIVADHAGWRAAFLTLAGAMALTSLATLWAPEPDDPRGRQLPSLADSVLIPLRELFGAPGAIALVLLIICYKIGDAFALKFFTAFMMHTGFTKTEIGLVVKAVLTTGSIIGAMLGGLWMIRLGLRRAMLMFAIVQAVTNLGYLLLASVGKSYAVMVGAVALDALASGMGNIASVALMMALCDKRFSAFQYAVLSMVALLPRYTLGGPAGWLADNGGWSVYYWTSFALALPGIALVLLMRRRIDTLDASQNEVRA